MMLASPQETLKRASTVARYAQLDRSEFPREVDNAMLGFEAIVETTKVQVEQGNWTPVQGIGTISAAAAQAFGYPELHGQPGPADLIVRALGANGQ